MKQQVESTDLIQVVQFQSYKWSQFIENTFTHSISGCWAPKEKSGHSTVHFNILIEKNIDRHFHHSM